MSDVYRNDPAWTEARDYYLRDASPDETPYGCMLRRIRAAWRLHRIEQQYAATSSA